MAHAQSHQDIQFRLFIIQNQCLENRVTHRFELTDGNLLIIPNRDFLFGQTADLADDGNNVKSLAGKNFFNDGGLLSKSHAKNKPQTIVFHLPGEFNHLFDSWFDGSYMIVSEFLESVSLPFLDG